MPSSTDICCYGTRWANPEDRPLYERRDELAETHGKARADWMIGNSRNLCLYPNVYLMDQFSSQIRIIRPISVDRTEVTIYCIAPRGESAEARSRRIQEIGLKPVLSGVCTEDEGLCGVQHRFWLESMRHAMKIEDNAVAPGGTDAPPRLVPRNDDPNPQTAQDRDWYEQIVTQTKQTSLMHRYGTIDEQVRAILFLASSEASYITGTILPVAGGDTG